jgi:4-diphosphocytidyl-2-C-methyl-D-erythritol kinase
VDEAPRIVSEPAPAKLNAFLRVLGRRDDGYHEVVTLLLPLTLADGVRAETAPDGLSLAVVGERSDEVPPGDDNLVLRAARSLAEACPPARGARLTLVKRIPVGAGLGGGSADAAAALRALNDAWGCGLEGAALAGCAAAVGSDVSAMLPGGPVVARGRGDRAEPVDAPRTWWVLVTQPFGVSAADAYRWWDQDGGPTGPDPNRLLRGLAGATADSMAGLVTNDLEEPVARRHPEVARARDALRGAGARATVMCGSGPTVAGLAAGGRQAEELAASVGGMAVSSIGGRR